MEGRLQLGQMLVDSKLLSPEQLKMAVDFQESVGGKLGAIVVKLGFIEDGTLINCIARQQGMTVVNLDELVIPEDLVKRIPKKLIEKHHVIPIRLKNDVLTIATSDPYDYEAMEEIQLAIDYRIEMQLAARSQILRTVTMVFNQSGEIPIVEKSKAQLLNELGSASKPKLSVAQLQEALVPLLVDKGVITIRELERKARELAARNNNP